MKTLLAVGVLAALGTIAMLCLAEDTIAKYEEDDMR